MMTSELIKRLEELVEAHGDVAIMIEEGFRDIEIIRYNPEENFLFRGEMLHHKATIELG